MGWLARTVVTGATMMIVGCASLAGIRDDDEASDELLGDDASSSGSSGSSGASGSNGSNGSSGTSGTSGSSGTRGEAGASGEAGTSGDAATTEDATVEAASQCTRKPDGQSCTAKSECCVDGCNEAKVCAQCTGAQGACVPTNAAPCCTGQFCSTVLGFPTCQACLIATETPRAQTFGGGAKSCCSRQIDAVTGKCK